MESCLKEPGFAERRFVRAMYTVGMEEEYFVFDAKTRRAVRRMNKAFSQARACPARRPRDDGNAAIADRGGDAALRQHAEARAHLARYRQALAETAAEHKLGIAAMGTFPLAFWPEQTVTPKARYGAIIDDLQMIGYRNMLCGMHVHVEVPDIEHARRSDHAADAVSAAAARALHVVAVLAGPPHRSAAAIGSPPMTNCRAPDCPNCFAPRRITTSLSPR